MPVSYKSFLTKDPLDNYEDPERYKKEWLPKVEKYQKDLDIATTPDYKVQLPKPLEELVKDKFNALEYFYDNKLLAGKELEITETSATDLVAQIASGKLTSVEVFTAFAKRTVIAQQFTKCASELFIDEGLKRAEFLDDYYKKNGKTIGPLHGLPISLKEQMNYKNKITHGGYVSKITYIPTEHGNTTGALEDLGAVFYVRTTQPQTLMHLDSNNNFTGLTYNPYNLSLSSGGSSSGEGAIVGFGGSAIGVGSDIGGSIRAPAAYAGVVGLRPTAKRISTFNGVSSGGGQESVPAVVGPLARSIEDIDLWMRTSINDGKPWERDGRLIRLPWRKVDKPELKNLTIAFVYDDGLVRPTPPIQRGLKNTADKLKAAGVKVVEWKPLRTKEAYETVNKMYTCDGNFKQRELLAGSGEPLTKLTKWNLNYGDGAKEYTVAENRKLNSIRDSLIDEYTHFLIDNKVDFIISPTYNNVAPQSEKVYNWSYTALFNILDFPTLVFQTGLYQDPSIDKWTDEQLKYEYRSPLEQLENENYKPEDFVGAPIGLQLSGRRFFDEEVVAAGIAINDVLGVDLFRK